ncbi:MAG: hypothetical protein H6861_02640 [Rhodospirillales bacterium]|nr:hypothetical protein [Rhodospirillales bacterium]
MKRKTKGWSEERRRKQAEHCRQTKPWTSTPGPQSEEGKARAAQNALEHGLRSAEMHELRRLLRKHRAVLKALNAQIDMNNP